MADFRRYFYALAVVGLLGGLTTIPASAQTPNVICSSNTSTNTDVRAEGYTEQVGDVVLTCTGGVATPAGTPVPQVNFTVSLNTNITSKITSSPFDEALLIIDDPNSAANPTTQILACETATGVCPMTSVGVTGNNYDGTTGHANVYQGQLGAAFPTIQFLGVPIDAPGTAHPTLTLRFTNIRADAEFIGVGASQFVQAPILMTITANGSAAVSITNPTLTVAEVVKGLLTPGNSVNPANAIASDFGFVQCTSTNVPLASGAATVIPSGSPVMRFQEGFASSWKTKNIAEMLNNGQFLGGWKYAPPAGGPTTFPDNYQDVPGALYNTESGFEFSAVATAGAPAVTATNPGGNPPSGTGSGPVSGDTANPFTGTTGLAGAGVASQGTRLALSIQNVPQGANVFVPSILYLSATSNPASSTVASAATTGVMVLTSTDSVGNGTFTPVGATGGVSTLQQVNNGLAVYEILFADPFSFEQVDVPIVVSYVSQISSTAVPGGLPQVGTIATASGGFAPFYVGVQAARQPSSSLPIPRFIGGNPPLNLFEINKCACDLLFPFVASTAGFDTGVAIANTSADPGLAAGFVSTGQQAGAVTFYYFGTGANGANAPGSQTSAVVPAGQVLTYVLSNGGGGIGTGPNGLDNRGAGFEGYIIAQTQFQYCHGFAFISALGQGATGQGISEGYLGIVLDNGHVHGFLPRTLQTAENNGN